MDINSIEYSLKSNTDKTVFVYAGGPGRKDYLKEIIEGFAFLTQEQISKIEFHIIGVDKKSLMKICGVSLESIEKLGKSLYIHGRLPREETIKWVEASDFSVLLRNSSLRYAQAGFPTKVVESLACGTPVICNLSSDLEKYMQDAVNGFIVSGHSANDFTKTVMRALQSSTEAKKQMRKKARDTAELFFDYRNYSEVLNRFLGETTSLSFYKSISQKKHKAD